MSKSIDPGITSNLDSDELALLLRLGNRLVSELDLDAVLSLVAEAAGQVVHAETLMVPIIDLDKSTFTYRAASGKHADTVQGQTSHIDEGTCGWVLKHQRPLLFGEGCDFELDTSSHWEKGMASNLLVPLICRGEIIGGLSAMGKQGGEAFNLHDLTVLTLFANQASVAIENARLFQELGSNEARLRTLVETLPDLVWLKDPEGVYMACNPNVERLFGAKESEILGKTDYDFVDKELADFFRAKDKAAMAAGGPSVNEEEITYADDGHRELLETIKTPMFGADHRLVGVLGVGRNITERKQAEMALLESEQQVRDLLYSTAEAIYGLDLQGKCTFVNPACAQMLGYQNVDELIGCNMHDKIHYKRSDGSVYPVDECPIFHAFHTGDGTHINNEVLWRADGSSFQAEYWAYPINRDGAVVGAVVTFLDITERRQADAEKEQLLHDKGERIKELQCLYGIAEATNKHNELEDILYDVVKIIPPGWHYPEYTKARIIIDNQEFVESPFEPTRWKQTCDLVVRNEYRGSIEVYYTREFPELDEGPFLLEERSLINGISKVLSERIERKQAEAERERLQRELQQAQKMDALGQLTGGIAHDFNNLLGIIMGYSELAKNRSIGNGDAKLAEHLERVLRASKRAKELVARMLAFSRDEASEKTPLQLQPILIEDIKMLRSILPASIEIQTEIKDDLPPVLLDGAHLNQLLINLSINARDAMEGEGNLTIRLGLARDIDTECATCHRQVTGDWVELSVSDTGSGIRVDVLDRIFEPFFTTKDVGKGTGMGLSVIHGIMRSHGGHVLVDTEPDKGSTIRLLFPPAVEEVSKTLEEVQPSEMLPQGHGEHILVLDDEPELAEYTGELLELHGYKVTIKTDSREALSLFKEDPGEFALLVTDQTMPGLTGVELTKQLREIRPGFPVTLCTGYSESISADAAKNIDIRYLGKPIDAEKLIRSVAELLG